MSQFNAPREEGYEGASYPSSTDDNSSSLVDMHYRQANQYSPGSYSAFPSLQEGQQHTYYGASYADPGTDPRHWSRGTNTYQDENHTWNVHRTAYPMGGMAEAFFEGTDQTVHGDLSGYQFQDAEASGSHYGSESAMGTEVSGYQQPDTTGRSGHARYRYTSGSTLKYPQETQGAYGESSHPSRAPLVRVHAPLDNQQGGLLRSTSASGYSEGSAYTFPNTESAMLSPNYGLDVGDEEDESSDGSHSEEQGPASPSGTDTPHDPDRKWRCRQAECAERRGFKRHADLMRHMSTVHHRGDQEKFDCVKRTCPRKGENGFTRKDHLTEHLRNFHLVEIPKRRGGRGQNRG